MHQVPVDSTLIRQHLPLRLLHLPTGIDINDQDDDSQLKDYEKAMKVLRARVYSKIPQERNLNEVKPAKSAVGTGDRSERIRTYSFPQKTVLQTTRIGLTLPKVDNKC